MVRSLRQAIRDGGNEPGEIVHKGGAMLAEPGGLEVCLTRLPLEACIRPTAWGTPPYSPSRCSAEIRRRVRVSARKMMELDSARGP